MAKKITKIYDSRINVQPHSPKNNFNSSILETNTVNNIPVRITLRNNSFRRNADSRTRNRCNLAIIPYTNCTKECNNTDLRKRQNELPIFLLSNVRSLLPKVEDLEVILKSNDVNCAFITETWLSD